MSTLIVTGGAGFIGANFVRHALAHSEAKIVVIDKLTYAGNLCTIADLRNNSRFTFVHADIGDRKAMTEVFTSHRPAAVLNFAAETHVDRSIDNPRPFIDTNISGTFELLEVSRKYVTALADEQRSTFRFLHISTDEVYGSLGPTGLFSETTPYAPNSPYSASKAAADHIVRAYFETYGLNTLITNCSNNYGPYQYPEKLVPLSILNAINGESLPIYGDGMNVRDWLYVDDHCAGILLALKNGRPGEKYNIGGDNERPNVNVIDTICSVLEEIMPAAQNPALKARNISAYQDLKKFVPDRPGHDRRYAIDASRIKDELGWKAAHTFESGIKDTILWYLNNKKWCDEVQDGKYQRERLGIIKD